MANENKKGGFEFGAGGREGRGGGRDGGRGGGREGGRGGDKRGGGRGGRDRDDRGGGGAHRVVTELPALEKALTQGDLARQKQSLDQILKGLRPLRLSSLEGLELGTRGKLLTTLVRVQRQPRPAGVDTLGTAPVAETGSAGEAAPEGTGADTPPEAPAAEPSGEETAAAAAEGAEPTEAAAGETAGGEASGGEREKAQGYQDVLTLVGRIWRAVGETDRANTAFELSGKGTPAEEAHEPEQREARGDRPERGERGERGPRGERGERGDRPARGERGERGPRGDRPERGERPERGARGERPGREDRRGAKEPLNIPIGGNWADVAKEWETAGRTRDAARVHEKNGSWADAARLFQAGGNPREALRCAVASHDDALIRTVLTDVKVEDARPVLEKAQAWELLMEKCVAAGDWETVAKLYERARQFDQAGLAWERAGKLSLARKSFERARDFKSVQRLRNLEVERLIERGDRMGAAQLLVQSRRKDEAVAVLLPLPAPKAYRFMERLKLDEAAKALARRELEKATTENKPANMARWLELLDESALAAEAWSAANRLDKASVCNERAGNLKLAAEQAESAGDLDRAQDLFRRAGDTENMERVSKLPRLSAEERKKRGPSAEQEAEDREHEAAHAEAASTPDAPAESTEASEDRAAPIPGAPEVAGPPGEPSPSGENQ